MIPVAVTVSASISAADQFSTPYTTIHNDYSIHNNGYYTVLFISVPLYHKELLLWNLLCLFLLTALTTHTMTHIPIITTPIRTPLHTATCPPMVCAIMADPQCFLLPKLYFCYFYVLCFKLNRFIGKNINVWDDFR